MVVTISAFSLYSDLGLKGPSAGISEVNFIYSDVETLQKTLLTHGIHMSAPQEITDHTVDQYCTFFDDDGKQQFVQACITTALLDSDGESLGNLNMGGNPITPIMALAVVESAPSLNSKSDEIGLIFQTMIETLVCDCWKEQRPGGFESVAAWVRATENQYDESISTSLKSKIDGLAQKQLILEVTSTGESYLWTLIIIK